jgi:hypothetical protein
LISIVTEPIPLRILAGQNCNHICPRFLDSIEKGGGKKGSTEVTGVAHDHARIQLRTAGLILHARNANPIELDLIAVGRVSSQRVCTAGRRVIAVVGGPINPQPAGLVTDRAVELANGVIKFVVVGARVITVDVRNIGGAERGVAGTVRGDELSGPVGGIPGPGIADRHDEIIPEQTSGEGYAATVLGENDETDASVRVLGMVGDRSLRELGFDDAFRLALFDLGVLTEGLRGQPDFWTPAFEKGVEVRAGQSFRFDGRGIGVEESEDFRSSRMHFWKVSEGDGVVDWKTKVY